MDDATPHPFGAPMPNEYWEHHYRTMRESVRRRAERSRLRAKTGLSSLRPRQAPSRWRSLISFLKGN
jgi:hypothetical protein